MENETSILQFAYTISAVTLKTIGTHPQKVTQGILGCFLEKENIKGMIGDFNPEAWYEKATLKERPITFDDLPMKDRWKVREVLNEFSATTISESSLIQLCNKCMRLSKEFDEKIDALGKRNTSKPSLRN